MPELTLSLPLILGLLALFLIVGGGLAYFGLQATGGLVEPTEAPTATFTPTATLTPTPLTPSPTATSQPSPTPSTYFVKSGDSCSEIAAIFGISVRSIIELNNLDSSCSLSPDQALLIPYPTPTQTPLATATLSDIEATRAACETDIYVVQENDTLSTIALIYGVPVEAIKEWNGLTVDTAFLGQTLSIPLCEREFILGIGTVTPSPAPPYPAPELLLPLDGQAFTLANDQVVLQWSSVGTLRQNEAYQVTITDITSGQNRTLVEEVFDTKFIVPPSFRPSTNAPHIFRWFVLPVAQRGVEQDGTPRWEAAGARSKTWAFTWSGAAPQATPTP